jgi:hypothetical protein
MESNKYTVAKSNDVHYDLLLIPPTFKVEIGVEVNLLDVLVLRWLVMILLLLVAILLILLLLL